MKNVILGGKNIMRFGYNLQLQEEGVRLWGIQIEWNLTIPDNKAKMTV
jgi:hypothetical protein